MVPDNGNREPGGQRKLSCGVNANPVTVELSASEQGALRVMRCYFMSYAKPQSVDWELGIGNAVKTFGEDKGPKVAWCCLRTVQAMRASRRTKFNFCNPFCTCCNERLTNNESHLMASLKAVSNGRDGEATLAAMMLCEGNPDCRFLAAIQQLGDELKA